MDGVVSWCRGIVRQGSRETIAASRIPLSCGAISPPHSLWTHTMNRCLLPTGLIAVLLFSLSPLSLVHAQAVQREFPAKALRGSMVIVQPPLVAMDDKPTRLAPGARILDTSNRLVQSATLVNQELTVNYTLDLRGQVHQVWLLSEAEAKVKRAGSGVQRNYTFESQQTPPAAGTTAPVNSN